MEAPQEFAEVAELTSRITDKLLVTLWWVRGTMDTYVTITDYDNHTEEVVEVPKGTLPHEVFRHPFAYLPYEDDAA